MRKFINDLVEKIGTYPVREEFVERRDYSNVTRTKVWSVLPIVQFLSDNWMLPVIQLREYSLLTHSRLLLIEILIRKIFIPYKRALKKQRHHLFKTLITQILCLILNLEWTFSSIELV